MDQYCEPPTLTEEDLDQCVIDEPEQGRFEVARRLFDDPVIFDLEMNYIFDSTWVYLCHESQVANAHDYFAGRIGINPVLVTRNSDGKIRAFLNSCTHRGAQLTSTKKGNKKTFMCPFHAWVFDSNGRCMVDAHDTGGYSEAFDRQNHDLVSVAKLENYKGFIFASLNPEVGTLQEHLGNAATIVDMMANQSEGGMEVLKGEIKYVSRSNWKTQLENIDGYHFFPTHLSYIGLIQRRMAQKNSSIKTIDVSEMAKFPGGAYQFDNGHCMNWGFMPNGDDRPLGFQRERIEKTFGKDVGRWMIDHVRNLIIYPNVLLMDQSSTTIRMIHPISADRTLIEIYCIAPKGEPAAARERRVRQFEDFLGPAGMATSDDQSVFEACQRSIMSNRIPMMQGYARGLTQVKPGPDKEAASVGVSPTSHVGNEDETLIHGAYRAWKKLMKAGLSQ